MSCPALVVVSSPTIARAEPRMASRDLSPGRPSGSAAAGRLPDFPGPGSAGGRRARRPAARTASPQLTRPRACGSVARERLFAQLAQAAAPVAWLTAAPGSGKTTLAAGWCESSPAAALWYQIDSGDAE